MNKKDFKAYMAMLAVMYVFLMVVAVENVSAVWFAVVSTAVMTAVFGIIAIAVFAVYVESKKGGK